MEDDEIGKKITDIEIKLESIKNELLIVDPPDVDMTNNQENDNQDGQNTESISGGSYKIVNTKENVQKDIYQKGGDIEEIIESSEFSEDFIYYLFKYNIFSQEDNLLEEQNKLFNQFSKEEICQRFSIK